jgi:hypothetical protein
MTGSARNARMYENSSSDGITGVVVLRLLQIYEHTEMEKSLVKLLPMGLVVNQIRHQCVGGLSDIALVIQLGPNLFPKFIRRTLLLQLPDNWDSVIKVSIAISIGRPTEILEWEENQIAQLGSPIVVQCPVSHPTSDDTAS